MTTTTNIPVEVALHMSGRPIYFSIYEVRAGGTTQGRFLNAEHAQQCADYINSNMADSIANATVHQVIVWLDSKAF